MYSAFHWRYAARFGRTVATTKNRNLGQKLVGRMTSYIWPTQTSLTQESTSMKYSRLNGSQTPSNYGVIPMWRSFTTEIAGTEFQCTRATCERFQHPWNSNLRKLLTTQPK